MPEDRGELDRLWKEVDALREEQRLLREAIPSKADFTEALKGEQRRDIEAAFVLQRGGLSALITETLVKHEADKEAAKRKILEEHGVGNENPIRAFITRNWGWLIVVLGLIGTLKPELFFSAMRFALAI